MRDKAAAPGHISVQIGLIQLFSLGSRPCQRNRVNLLVPLDLLSKKSGPDAVESDSPLFDSGAASEEESMALVVANSNGAVTDRRRHSRGSQGRAAAGVGAGFSQLPRYVGYSGADRRRAAGTGSESYRAQNDRRCGETLLSAWARGFSAGTAIGHAEVAD